MKIIFRIIIAWMLCWHGLLVLIRGSRELERLHDVLDDIFEKEKEITHNG